MLRVPKMKNPFSLAVSSYEMNDMGKLAIGATIAQVAASAYARSERAERERHYYEQEDEHDECMRDTNDIIRYVKHCLDTDINFYQY